MEFNKIERDRLDEILAIDFMDYINDKEGMIKLWNEYLKQCVEKDVNLRRTHVVDLSGNFNVTEDVLMAADPQWANKIKEIVVYQNSQFLTWTWLKSYTNLKTLSFWHCFQLSNDNITHICKVCPVLESVSIHDCFQINNRALLPMLIKPSVTKVCLDNRMMICQTNTHQGVITNKEWPLILNTNLEYLYINSDNLTNDVIDNIIGCCSKLKKFLMNTLVLKRLKENLIEGIDAVEITFQSCEDLKLGFKARRDIKIKNLLRDQYEDPFSESMKALIMKKGHFMNIPDNENPILDLQEIKPTDTSVMENINDSHEEMNALEKELMAEIAVESPHLFKE